MVRTTIGNFSIEYSQVLDEQGNIDSSLAPQLSESQIKELYHLMKLTRTFDEKFFLLQRSGKIGTYAQVKGQEGAQIGSGFALAKEDWMVPSFREMGVYITRGVNRAKLVQAWRGDVRAFEGEVHNTRDLPVAIPIASQCLHAAGIAWASKIKKEKSAAIAYFGDGATSEGDFHEALNFAGEFKLPVVFFCQNNQWAISTPRTKQTAAPSIAQKAIAYGIRGIQIDGNDVLGVYAATKDALERAYRGEGPTLIEAMTFRMGDHTTSDDSSKYRSPELVKQWEAKDPLLRLELYFKKIGTWSDDYGKWVASECEKEVAAAIDAGLAITAPPVENLFAHVFEKPTPDQIEQLEMVKREIAQRGAK
ncbi:MAG TPA: pyruvate dehydrogenase (acetyl-transferring) E1 component subunit alpha [Acidobacteriota bacterium]|nr:pyruvate dehydrogenase (acetyl-transferring) E1 component subunit alpha [Acidobacteriota bacterium]